MESNKLKNEKPKHPRAKANILSALTFSWTLPLFLLGNKRELETGDLYEPLQEHTSSRLGNKFEKAWNAELEKSKKKKKEPSLARVIFAVYGFQLLALGMLVFFNECVLRIAQPILLGKFIEYFTPGSTIGKDEAYLYAIGIILTSSVDVILMHPFMFGVMHIGMKVRVAMCSIIYRKALRLSKTALGQTTVGQVVNLLSNDVSRFDIAFLFPHYLWIGPIQTILATYFLWQLIGPVSLIGLLTVLIFIPLQALLGRTSSLLRAKTAEKTDERIRLMNEIINGIQVIKMYTWEKPFASLVSFVRRKEIAVIRKSSYIRGIMLSFIIFHTRTSIFCSILAYVLFENIITAQKVFVVTSFYNTLRQTMTIFFPQGITQIAEAVISLKRIQKFLLYDETTNLPLMLNENSKNEAMIGETPTQNHNNINIENSNFESKEFENKPFGIFVKNATAKWTENLSDNTLSHVDLEVTPRKLVAVIGAVGSGKTSLFHALLKELPLSDGSISINGTVSYASQEPWLFVGSVRQNILFGEPYNKERYREVIRVCALRTDLEQFPFGDKTMVGERGVSLSGGQRARINLARAVYKQADVYLLDDPLSAVDTHVGKHLFEDCITGYLKDKTVLLVTHQLQYLNNVDKIIILENGCVKAEGSYSGLMSKGESILELLQSNQEETEEELAEKMLLHSRRSSLQSVVSSIDDFKQDPTEVAEIRSSGSVSGYVYLSYLTAGGGWALLLLTLFLSVFSQFLASSGDYWITYWVNLEEHVYTNSSKSESYAELYLFVASRDTCIYVFTAITIGTIVFTLVRSFLFFYMCMKSSTNLHDNMFTSITQATMNFFNTNSSGRILNRFSKDMGSVDELLPAALIDCLQIGLTLLAIIIVIAMMNFWLLVPTMVAGVIFYFLRMFYLTTSRGIKRLEGVTRSPVFAHLNASLQGLTTIRAFNAQAILEKEFDYHQDLHSTAWYLFIASSRAFGYWLDMVCLVYIALVTISFLFFQGESFGGNVGLAITQSIGLTGMFQWGMRQSAELENQMTSVERILEYSNLESEPPLESSPDKKPKESWPESGKIAFQQVFLRYGEDNWVLKNLNFVILPQQKVGIVGRTGAGKSSLITALFRLTEIKGSILIDDVNVGNIGLHDLRSKISIIPQEPVLFSGPLRKNLDPFNIYKDEVLWSALEEVELKEAVSELPGGLNTKISEGGTNMSVGQRQLLCLARAIIRNNKILVLDEATANVDPKTDGLIQITIRKKFASCTVLTIAHRLHTIMDSDKVLVMDNGTMAEFDHPYILLQNNQGFLFKMVEQSGKATAETLHEVAKQNYEKLAGH